MVADIQPELLFEQASFLIGAEVLTAWDILRVSGARPNIYHYLLVTVASHYGTPIITLNFDTLLERAARDCGLKTLLYVPRVPELERFLTDAQVPEACCSIWKIHGCIETRDAAGRSTLHNTLSQIARPNLRLLSVLERLISETRIYIVGYSGRDGEFFPELAQLLRRQQEPRPEPVWIDPEFKGKASDTDSPLRASIHDRRRLIGAAAEAADLTSVSNRHFPWWAHRLRGLYPALDADELSRLRSAQCDDDTKSRRLAYNQTLEHQLHSKLRLSDSQKEALLMCLLLHSGHIREAYEYGKGNLERWQSALPPHFFSAVTLSFARVCDWNSQYEQFRAHAQAAMKLGHSSIDPVGEATRLFVEIAGRCLLTRAESMLLGPVMSWPDECFTFRLRLCVKLALLCRCLETSLRVRHLLGAFRGGRLVQAWRLVNPKPPREAATVEEVLAWQYYLDHRQVLLNYLLLPLARLAAIRPRRGLRRFSGSGLRLLCKFVAWGALFRIRNLVRLAGAAYCQADIYLFRSRYGLANDLEFAEHLWGLVNHPVGHALILRDRGVSDLRAGRYSDAAQHFLSCYQLSSKCGSHLTALKALIGLFHVRRRVERAEWQEHLEALEGAEHVKHFHPVGKYIKCAGGFV